MSSNLTSGVWWKDAFIRAIRTAVVIAVPYVGGSLLSAVPWLTVASAAALGFVASLITSLAGLPDANSQPWWQATLTRVTKTVAQSLAAGLTNIVLFQDVNWSVALQASAIAGLGSLLLAVISSLPEATEPTQAVVVTPVATGPIPIQPSPTPVVHNPVSATPKVDTADTSTQEPEGTTPVAVAPAVPNIAADGSIQK